MSDVQQGPDWWLASDGRWYPPAAPAGTPAPPTTVIVTSPDAPIRVESTETNGLAIASLVLGILWLYWIGSFLALIFGFVAKRQMRKPQNRQRGSGLATAGIVLGTIGMVTLVLVVLLAALVTSSTKSAADRLTQFSTSGQTVYAIGESAHTGDFDVTVKQAQNPYAPSNQFEKPDAGQHFVAVEVVATNTAKDEKTLSTLLSVELHDSLNRAWHITLAGFDLPQLNGTLAASETRDGWVVFSVADDAVGLRLRIRGDLTSTGSLFDLGS